MEAEGTMTTATMEAPKKTAKAAAIKLPLLSLSDALTKISPALAGATTVPVLKSVKVEAGDGFTSFTATNLDLAIRVTTYGAAGGDSAFLMPSDRLLSYVKLLEDDEVSLAPGDRRVTLKCGRATTQFPVMDAKNFPLTKFGSEGAALTMKQSDLLALLRHTLFAASEEESRYTLNGALLEATENEVRMVSTDGHRLALFTAPSESGALEPVILPLSLMQALYKALEEKSDLLVTLGSAVESVMCEVGDAAGPYVSISHRKLTGTFPNYKAVIPSGSAGVSFKVDIAGLLASLLRCVSMSDKKTTCVKMTFSPDQILMKAVDSEAGETEESISVLGVPFDTFTTGFNGHYLIQALKRMTFSDECVFEFAKAEAHTTLKITHSSDKGAEFVYVVMPMRVRC
jgi:DNA polymerase-3 subunit beta